MSAVRAQNASGVTGPVGGLGGGWSALPGLDVLILGPTD